MDRDQREQDSSAAGRYELGASQFRAAFSKASIGMMVISTDGDYLLVNEAFARLTGYSAAELYGMSYRDITHPDDLPVNEELVAHLPNGESSFDLVKRYVHKNGSTVWVKKFATLVRDADGKDSIVGIVQDITSERAAREDEARLRFLVEHIQEGVFISDAAGKMLYMNPAARLLGGISPDTPDLGFIKDYVPAGDEDRFRQRSSALLESRQWTGLAFLNNRATGEAIPAHITTLNLSDPGTGAFSGRATILRDLREEHAARATLAERDERLKTAIELAELGTWSIDIAAGMVTYSGIVRSLYGLPEGPVPLSEMRGVHPDDAVTVAAAMAAAMEPGSSGIYDNEHRALNELTGEIRYVHSQGRVLRNAAGDAYLITGTLQDITARRAARRALEDEIGQRTAELRENARKLKDANTNLMQTNSELEQYAYVASHDLQEPLRKISVFSGMLEKMPGLPPAAVETAGKISAAAGRMTLLIRDLLEFSRLLKAERATRPVDLNAVLDAVLVDFELQIGEKGATILKDALPTIEAVGLQMNQLFYNIIGNALKFIATDRPPKIEIRCSLADPSECGLAPLPHVSYYRIAISDNGIGFNSQYAEQIFEVFKRLHTRSVYPGSGIGLALCRRIVQNHGGTLMADSEDGKGTTIIAILPSHQPAAAS